MKTELRSAAAAPWWGFGMVWLVVGGPALVVVAAVVTAVIAFRGADVPLERVPLAADGIGAADAPAVQARNHAATARR